MTLDFALERLDEWLREYDERQILDLVDDIQSQLTDGDTIGDDLDRLRDMIEGRFAS